MNAMADASEFCVLLTTAGSEEEARKLAHALVERKLAACVNIVPQVESIYRWQGKVETANEWILIVKTSREQAKEIEQALRELHSYELPECIWLDVAGGSDAYLRWLGENVRGSEK